MTARHLLAALLAAAPLALEAATSGALALGRGPRLSLALLPWLALAGLPATRRALGRSALEPLRSALAAPLLALPVLGLATGLDLARSGGPGPGEAAAAGGAGLLLVLLLALAAAGAGRLHGPLWLVLVVLAPALAAAFELAASSRGAPAPAFVGWAARQSPLGWAWSEARGESGGVVGPVAIALVLLATVPRPGIWPGSVFRIRRNQPRGKDLRPPERAPGGRARGAGGEMDLRRSRHSERGQLPRGERGGPSRLLAVGFLGAVLQAAPENRLWTGDLLLRGPLAEGILDAGSDGGTVVRGPLRAGEEIVLQVPVPVRSPLGAGSLGLVPPPEASAEGSDGPGEARWLGWSGDQPAARWAEVTAGLRARPRPPAEGERPRPTAGAVLAVLAVTALGAALRRRTGALAALGVGGLGLGIALGLRGPAGGEEVRVLEGDVAAERWLRVTSAPERLALDLASAVRLEAFPDGPIAVEGSAGGRRFRAAAPGAVLVLHALAAPVPLGAGSGPELAEAWTRTARGTWRFHGAWRPEEVGEPLALPRAGPDPPGWLAAALPPGTGVLLGRAPDGEWLRVTGVDLAGLVAGAAVDGD